MPNLLQDGKVPSVLNGGLSNEYVVGTLAILLLVGAVLEKAMIDLKEDLKGPKELANFYNMFNEEGFDVPGNYQFDPLGFGKILCGDDKNKR